MTRIQECPEPWLYWWLLLPLKTQINLCKRYFPQQHGPLTREQRKQMWQAESQPALTDDQWLELGESCINDPFHPSPIHRKEIWRQVYRIASHQS